MAKHFHMDKIQFVDAGVNGIRVAICEDNQEQAEQLRQILENLQSEMKLTIKVYRSAKTLLKTLEHPKPEFFPDVFFLDIEMPDIDGITCGKAVRKLFPNCFLIFTTAYEEYAIKGYEAQAFRYLLKPISSEGIRPVMQYIQETFRRKKKIRIQSADKEQIIDLQDLIYLSAEDKYTILYTKEEYFIDRRALNEYEELLQMYGFYRIHRKYIVNLYYHKSMQRGRIALSTGMELPISRRREADYHRKLLQDLEKELLK